MTKELLKALRKAQADVEQAEQDNDDKGLQRAQIALLDATCKLLDWLDAEECKTKK